MGPHQHQFRTDPCEDRFVCECGASVTGEIAHLIRTRTLNAVAGYLRNQLALTVSDEMKASDALMCAADGVEAHRTKAFFFDGGLLPTPDDHTR